MNTIIIRAKKYGQVTKIYIDDKEVCSMPSIPSACIKQINAILNSLSPLAQFALENILYVSE